MPKAPSVITVPRVAVVRYVGIDPGRSGGISVVARCGEEFLSLDCFNTPQTEVDMLQLFRSGPFEPNGYPIYARVEKVGGYIAPNTTSGYGEGGGQPGSAMFNFGFVTGGIRMACLAAGITMEEVNPATWQKALGITGRKKFESKTEWKNRLKAAAQRLYPEKKVTLPIADSILIAEFCYRKRNGLA